jgi:hypothetical protein
MTREAEETQTRSRATRRAVKLARHTAVHIQSSQSYEKDARGSYTTMYATAFRTLHIAPASWLRAALTAASGRCSGSCTRPPSAASPCTQRRGARLRRSSAARAEDRPTWHAQTGSLSTCRKCFSGHFVPAAASSLRRWRWSFCRCRLSTRTGPPARPRAPRSCSSRARRRRSRRSGCRRRPSPRASCSPTRPAPRAAA